MSTKDQHLEPSSLPDERAEAPQFIAQPERVMEKLAGLYNLSSKDGASKLRTSYEAYHDELAGALAEPYRIKAVEKVRLLSRAEREQRMKEAHHSIVHLNAEDVFIDLITDSGTGAMSDHQWAALMKGDESYFRARSFNEMRTAVQEILGFKYVVPTHQGRAAEHILMKLLITLNQDFIKRNTKKQQPKVLSNTHFDTTRAHVMHVGALPVDLIGDKLFDFDSQEPFKGNFDLEKLKTALDAYGDHVPFVMITVLNNFACSAPVSMENIREVSRLARAKGIPVFFDACRFAENAYFIKQREKGYADKSVPAIVKEMMDYGDGCWMSAKKDAIVNIGGFIAVRERALAKRCEEMLVLFEGFPSYGGLSGRDMEALAVGLYEGVDEHHLAHRTGQVAYLANLFEKAGIKTSKPAGGSGVFVDVNSLYGHLKPEQFPAIALTCDLYLEGGIRAGAYPFHFNTVDARTGEIRDTVFQFARFAIPRRTYTTGHLDYIAKVMTRVKEIAPRSKGFRITYAPEVLEHFFSKFEPWPVDL